DALPISIVVFASEGESSLSFVKILRGKMSISGSAGGGYATQGIGFFSSSELGGQYYLLNKFALGVDLSLAYTTGGDRFYGLAGPSLLYHFWNGERVSFYTKLSLLADMGQPLKNNMVRTEVGMDYSLSKVLSVGPYLRVTNHFQEGTGMFTTANVGGRMTLHF
ncbi:hypothetical protein, partial [uncultured Thiothrix sp.]|uniref:hypothetical protein n=1 Tax=uncultured Thiothrix sp. TaxID=223185 RepID=UPI002626FA07